MSEGRGIYIFLRLNGEGKVNFSSIFEASEVKWIPSVLKIITFGGDAF